MTKRVRLNFVADNLAESRAPDSLLTLVLTAAGHEGDQVGLCPDFDQQGR